MPLQDLAVMAGRRTALSFCEFLDCPNLPLDGFAASVGVAVSEWTFFVDEFSGDVPACFVSDVDDVGLLVALQDHYRQCTTR